MIKLSRDEEVNQAIMAWVLCAIVWTCAWLRLRFAAHEELFEGVMFGAAMMHIASAVLRRYRAWKARAADQEMAG